MSQFKNIIRAKCPKCNKGDIFHGSGNILLLKTPKMHDSCPNCQHVYEIEPGYFFGAMYVSYGMVVAEMIALYIVANMLIESTFGLLFTMIGAIVLLGSFNYKYARVIWMYMFTRNDSTSTDENTSSKALE